MLSSDKILLSFILTKYPTTNTLKFFIFLID